MTTNKTKNNSPFYIAGIGASAGGLEALQKFLSHLPEHMDNIAFIVAQHLSPTYKSKLAETLKNNTRLNVVEIKNSVTVKEKNIYITPPNCEISIKNGKLQLSKPARTSAARPSIDNLFISLAADKSTKTIGIILSGTGADGAKGIKAIKEAGGITFAQDPPTAKYDGMPLASIETAQVDYVLAPEKIGSQLQAIIESAEKFLVNLDTNQENRNLDAVIEILSRNTGTDFTNYKQNTLYRRITKRFSQLKIRTANQYLDYIEKTPEELDELFHTVLIGVTGFFRDAEVFKALEKVLLPIIHSKSVHDPIRIWIVGCATGEEAYSVAISLAKLQREKRTVHPVQIIATDVNEHSLDVARKGIYAKKELHHLPPEILKNYFTSQNGNYEINKTIRSTVLFSRHDLTNNPPFLKLDLIVCRNLLIYFNNKLQDHVFPIFHSALQTNGYLLLGKSESISHFTNLFSLINRTAKIYQRKAAANMPKVRFTPFKSNEKFIPLPKPEKTIAEMAKETIFQAFEWPYVIVNDNLDVQEIRGDISKFLGLKSGQMNTNLIKLAHKDLKIELRSLLNKCILDKKQVKGPVKKIDISGKDDFVKITIYPLLFSERPDDYYLVVFEEIKIVKSEKQPAFIPSGKNDAHRIMELEKELESVKEDLQSFLSRLEDTNAELQSTNEELQAANEEMKISNEELETANEELQSANEEINIAYTELKNTNEELELREIALHKSEANVNALLNNTLQAFVLMDANYHVLAYNNVAHQTFRNIFGKKIEVGDLLPHLISTDLVNHFTKEFEEALKGKIVTAEKEIKNIKGQSFGFMMNCTPVMDKNKNVQALSFSLLDMTEFNKTKTELIKSQELVNSVFHTTDIGIAVVNEKGKYVKTNEGYNKLFSYNNGELDGKPYSITVLPLTKKEILEKKADEERLAVKKNGEIFTIFRTTKLLNNIDGSKLLVVTARDISETKKYKELLQNTEKITKMAGWEFDLITKRITCTEELYNIIELKEPDFNELTPKKMLELFFDADMHSVIHKNLNESIHKGMAFDLEFLITTTSQKKKWIRITCKPERLKLKTIRLNGIIQDITQTKEAELQLIKAREEQKIKDMLEQQQKLFNAIAKNFPEGMIGVLDKKFHYVYAGGSEISKWGLTWKQLVGGKLFDHLSEKSNANAVSFLRKALEGENVVFEATILNKIYIVNAVPLREAEKEISQILIVLCNITGRKKIEEDLYEALKREKELNQLKSGFVSIASHEFRTPLSTVLSSAYLIEKYTAAEDQPKREVHLERIISSVNMLIDILNDLLNVGKIEEGKTRIKLTRFNMEELIIATVKEITNNLKKKQKIIYLHEEGDPNVLLDASILKHIIMNLVSNASKFSSEKGLIEIKTLCKDQYIKISVKDNGIGISKEDQKHLAERFFRGSNAENVQGTGLGLHIVSRYAELLNGSLECKSELRKGTEFIITFKTGNL